MFYSGLQNVQRFVFYWLGAIAIRIRTLYPYNVATVAEATHSNRLWHFGMQLAHLRIGMLQNPLFHIHNAKYLTDFDVHCRWHGQSFHLFSYLGNSYELLPVTRCFNKPCANSLRRSEYGIHSLLTQFQRMFMKCGWEK